jgi:hypothetical protein
VPDALDFGVNLACLDGVDGKALTFCLFTDGKACSNLARVSIAGVTASIKHTKSVHGRLKAIGDIFAGAHGYALSLRNLVAHMAMVHVDGKILDDFSALMYPKTKTKAKKEDTGISKGVKENRERLKNDYYSALGAMPGTGWGLVQAMTYHNTHNRVVRVGGRSERKFKLGDTSTTEQRVLTSRLDSNLWGAGHAQNEKAFNFVYNLAGLETTSRGAVRI